MLLDQDLATAELVVRQVSEVSFADNKCDENEYLTWTRYRTRPIFLAYHPTTSFHLRASRTSCLVRTSAFCETILTIYLHLVWLRPP
jgi:hypothetical protein